MRLFNSKIDIASISMDKIGNIPITVLSDFCNAFPTVLHCFLFNVLVVLCVPLPYRNAIMSLYTKITAYSSGVGDGSFLFNVLCGVKTGCPLSSILFILCVNPFIFVFNWMSDNPGFSITRVCADDFGSAMDQLYRIKTQASIFRLAQSTAGLHLKPCKCIIIITCISISDELISAVRAWLRDNVPEFQDFLISSSGKYLGWHLGRDSVELSFQDPIKKFVHRVHEIVAGNAPAPTAIVRYNQRAVPVLSFVSQFACPPVESNFPELDQWSVHKLLRIPSNCMSRKLCHTLACFTEVDPISLSDYCCANLFRFAHSQREYLLSLHARVTNYRSVDPRQDNITLCSINAPLCPDNLFDIPKGGISDTPILVSLLHALNFSGPFSSFKQSCSNDPARNWIVQGTGQTQIQCNAKICLKNKKSLIRFPLAALICILLVANLLPVLALVWLKICQLFLDFLISVLSLRPLVLTTKFATWAGNCMRRLRSLSSHLRLLTFQLIGGMTCIVF